MQFQLSKNTSVNLDNFITLAYKNKLLFLTHNRKVTMNNKDNNKNAITRKEAIKKMGKYAALTAAGTFLILNPQKSQASSPANPGGDLFPD